MSYTWEEVMLNIDVRDEAERERQQQQDILDKQASEETAMGLWSLGLSLVGGALFGPAGYAAGKIAGRGIGDIRNTWEADAAALDTGKFYKREGEDFKNLKKAEAKDQFSGQVVQGVTDLAMMYVQAGGLKEGFEGMSDLTTFGTGEDAWTMFGKGTWADKIPGAKTLPGEQSIFAGGGTNIFQKGGLKQLSANLKKGNLKSAWATDQGINTLSDLGRLALSYQESEEEKPKGSMLSSVGRFAKV